MTSTQSTISSGHFLAKELVSISKFLSLVLRHKPEFIGLCIDSQGWADVDELLSLLEKNGRGISMDFLLCVVRENDKQRFIFNADETKIRASQGHSISVNLGLEKSVPPDKLYHGTATRFLDSIRIKGLLRGHRQHVHLSADVETALAVGNRHGKPTVLIIAAQLMSNASHEFYLSENGVWLSENVSELYIRFPN